jgi:DNA polymerase-3 subunit delta'
VAAADEFRLSAWDRLEGIPDPGETPRLFGHDGVLDMLASRHAGGRMHHAWLLSGPSGIGKATLALRFAGHVFRHPDPASAPKTYLAPQSGDAVESRVARGGHPNLLHLRRPLRDDGKTWRTQLTIEEIRRTVPFFGNSAAEAGPRVAIVDTADDLNANAANALLKILEEPPPRAIFFILANTPGAMLATIRSRCQFVAMRPLDPDDVHRAIAQADPDLDAGSPDAGLAVELCAGSVRRAILILREGGADIHRRLAQLMADPGRPDWNAVHALADKVAPAANAGQYRLLLELAHDMILRRIRGEAEPGGTEMPPVSAGDVGALARLAEAWERTRETAKAAEAYNLDRKQVVLDLFQALRDAA